jgi:predicted DNA-binding transcriptional regulator AlpA
MQEPAVIPEQGFLRIWQITGCRKRGVAPLIPISRSLWWRRVAEGTYPPGVLLGPRTRVWPVASIRKLLADLEAQGVR